MIVLPVLLGIFSTGEAQDLTCPTGVVKPSSFYVVGASGGDIKVGVEQKVSWRRGGRKREIE